MIEALQARPEGSRVEVHEKTRRTSGQLQVRDHLRLVDGIGALHSFHFDDDLLLDEEINLKPIGYRSTSVDLDSSFCFKRSLASSSSIASASR